MEKQYSWKYGNRFDPDMVGHEFEAIERRNGVLTKKAVVDAARPVDSPMHEMYEWDDAVAGELWRENQAGYYIRMLEVKIVPVGNPSGKPVTTRGFVNVAPVAAGNAGQFMNVRSAISQPETYKIVLDRATNELRMFRDKYSDFKELEPVFAAINQVTMQVS